jgi:hypothetical protein
MTAVSTLLALAALLLAVVLAVVVAAMLRAIDRLRADVAALRADARADAHGPPVDPVAAAIPVGAAAPPFTATAADGSAFASADLAGTLRVVAFARPGCPPCEELVPSLLRGAERGDLPPAVVVSRGGPSDQPAVWLAAGPRGRLVMEQDDGVSDLFGSIVSPQVFVVTAGDRIGARGIAANADDVRELVDAATRWSDGHGRVPA